MNKNEIIVKQNDYLNELRNTQELCGLLMKIPHYSKMGLEGIFAIVETAKSLNIDPRQALSGGLYFAKGRVEMSSRMMASLIRAKKHSITRDSKSDDKICILHGRRADTKDCWTESFSIEEAKKAGIIKHGGPWTTYPRDMLYARALSRLARQLFPDVIGNTYIKGEIGEDPNIEDPNINEQSYVQSDIKSKKSKETPTIMVGAKRSDKEVNTLVNLLKEIPDYRQELEDFLQKQNINSFADMPKELYDKVLKMTQSKVDEFIEEGAINGKA